ncbi:MAG: arsenate reductase [Candidatus Azotimanducaceae bacterium]|jgi:arsenate reductase
MMSIVTIYHNPRCSKSRQTLSLINEKDITPEIILYKESPLSSRQIAEVVLLLGIKPLDLIRQSEPEFQALGNLITEMTDDELVDLMVKNPTLIQRPIVVANGQARIGRPPESVLEIL